MSEIRIVQNINKFPGRVKRWIHQKTIVEPIIKKRYPSNAESILQTVKYIINDPKNAQTNNQILRINQGTNHQVYKIEQNQNKYLAKITSSNLSNRLEREFLVLDFLSNRKLNLSPYPVFFKIINNQYAVLIETWIEGEVLTNPPKNQTEWKKILHHYQDIHAIIPTKKTAYLPKADRNTNTRSNCLALIKSQLKNVRLELLPEELKSLLLKMEENLEFSETNQKTSLCRGDGNFTNFIRQGEKLISVDWEYSGWGDPLFDLVSLLAHPSYVDLSLEDIFWAIGYSKPFYPNKNFDKIIISYLVTLFLYWAARYINLLQNTNSQKPFAWRDRPSLRLQNYEIYIDRAGVLLKG
ncbi:MAG: hypothetical protein CL609_08645 [Anaerolineaceae bacterium]|nr:hypothetical protein [Anaerolineaceae bacterium]